MESPGGSPAPPLLHSTPVPRPTRLRGVCAGPSLVAGRRGPLRVAGRGGRPPERGGVRGRPAPSRGGLGAPARVGDPNEVRSAGRLNRAGGGGGEVRDPLTLFAPRVAVERVRRGVPFPALTRTGPIRSVYRRVWGFTRSADNPCLSGSWSSAKMTPVWSLGGSRSYDGSPVLPLWTSDAQQQLKVG